MNSLTLKELKTVNITMDTKLTRRDFVKSSAATLGAVALSDLPAYAEDDGKAENKPQQVFFTKDISPEGLKKIYGKLEESRKLTGKVAVKLHSGEPGGHHYPAPSLIKDLVKSVKGTVVECNTAYPGKRFKTEDHKQALKDHGFTDIAPTDIMDEDGSMVLPFPKGKHIKENYVGSHFANYDSFLILSHFKGHMMGGFGGALKNTSIGIASGEGKMWIHTAGETKDLSNFGACFQTEQDKFLESMAEAAGSVMNKLGSKIAYINIMNNLSIDCDCDSNPAKPELEDIGILASLDPVALDKACVDLIYSADAEKSASLRKRIESKHGTHILAHAEKLGLGSRKYELISIDA